MDAILQHCLAQQDRITSDLITTQKLLSTRMDNIDVSCNRYDDYIPNIDYCFEAIDAYIKGLAIKLLNIGIDYRTDCTYTIIGNNITLNLKYYISGNTLEVKIENQIISYNDREITIHKLMQSPGWENIILCDIRGLLNRFNTINS